MDLQRRAASRLLIPLGLAASLSLFGDLSLYAGLVTRLDLVKLTLAEAGILLSIHRLIRIPGNPLVGMLMDRAGRRPLFLLGMVLAVVSSVGYGMASGFWPFLLARLAWGTAWALINVGGLTMILDVSVTSTRGRLTGLYNTWVWGGYAAGPLIGGILVDAIGFRGAMLACAGFSAIGLLAAGLFLPETLSRNETTGQPARERPRFHPWVRLLALFETGRNAMRENPAITTAMVLYGITQFAGDGVILSTVALLLKERFSQGINAWGLTLGVASASGILLAIRSLLASGASPLAGRISDGRMGRLPMIAASLLAGIVTFFVLAYAQALPWLVAGVALSALSGGAALAVLAAYMGDSTPPGRQGAAMGVYATAGDIGSAAGPALAFALVPLVGLKSIYLFAALIFLAGIGLLVLRRTGQPVPSETIEI